MGAMKALATQFDDRRLSNAVATPICSSCCCCCCCLATSVASSSLLAQRIAKEGEEKQVPNRHILTVFGALFLPITGLLVYLAFWSVNSFLQVGCNPEVVSTCGSASTSAIIPLIFIVPTLILWFLYSQVSMKNPGLRALGIMALITLAFVVEFFAGAAMILTGVGGIVYLILVPIIIGWISVWYHRHLGRKDTVKTDVSIAAPKPPQQ